MDASRFEISPYKLPETVSEARRSLIAEKVLELFGILHPYFDYHNDNNLKSTLEAHRDRSLLIATDTEVSPEDSSVKGFLAYAVDPEYSAMTLHHLAVGEDTRRCGVGRALLSRVEAVAEQGDLLSVNVRSLDAAVPFYASSGYEMVDGRDNMMQLRLPRR